MSALYLPERGKPPQRAVSVPKDERVLYLTLQLPTSMQPGQVEAFSELGECIAIPWYIVNSEKGGSALADRVLQAARALCPTLVLMQIQGAYHFALTEFSTAFVPEMFRNLRALSDPNCVVVNWCGDVYAEAAKVLPAWLIALAAQIDVALFSNCDYPAMLRRAVPAVSAGFLQCAYSPTEFDRRDTAGLNLIGEGGLVWVATNYDGRRAALAAQIEHAFPRALTVYGGGWKDSGVRCPGHIDFRASSFLHSSARLVLSDAVLGLRRCTSGRMARVMGSGGCYLAQAFDDCEGFGIVNGKHALLWHDVPELLGLIHDWIRPERDADRAVMQQAAYDLARNNWTWSVAARELLWIVQQERAARRRAHEEAGGQRCCARLRRRAMTRKKATRVPPPVEAAVAEIGGRPGPAPPGPVEQARALLRDAACYQTHVWGGEPLNAGICGLERQAFWKPEDFAGKSVLDLGCATGSDLFRALELGAAEAAGIELHPRNVQLAQALAAILDAKLSVQLGDLRKGVPEELRRRPWHTVLCSAILQHVGYRPLWLELDARVVYIVGGAEGAPYTLQAVLRPGWIGALLGMAPNNSADKQLVRPVYRLERVR